MDIIILLIIWTWGLTPLWVNITATVYIALVAILKVTLSILKADDDQ